MPNIPNATRLHLNGNDGLHPHPFTSSYITSDNMNVKSLLHYIDTYASGRL